MDDAQVTDTQQLIQAAQAGNATSVESLFARYHPIVCKIVAAKIGQRLRDFLDHEDVV